MGTVDDVTLLLEVVEAGSLSAASRKTGIPKSRLSRRIGDLESRLGVHLINRGPRNFAATEIGLLVCERGQKIRDELDAIKALADDHSKRPSGSLRISCPAVLSEILVAEFAIRFTETYPDVRLTLDHPKGTFDPKIDHCDLAIHPARDDLVDSGLIRQKLATTPYCLVAAPSFMQQIGACSNLADIDACWGIGWAADGFTPRWRIIDRDGEMAELHVTLRFCANNLNIIRQAALRGLGLARLPITMCRADLENGSLVLPLPNLSPLPVTIYALFPSRRALTVAGRLFMSDLARFLQEKWRQFDDLSGIALAPPGNPKRLLPSRLSNPRLTKA